MNKITTTAGMFALSAASLHAAVDAMPAGSQQATKPWSISATLRGFYDDNYSTSPKDLRRDSFGFEISPSASLNLIRDQTTFGLSYVYSFRWYEDRDSQDLPSDDQSHLVNAKLSHAFSPRFKLDLSDSFAVAQEPELLDNNRVLTTFLRSDGDNLRNFANASFSAGLTENLTAVLGYANEYYDYDEEGPNSRSAFLDRMEHLGSVNLRQVVLPKTVAVAGYQFEVVDYNAPSSRSPIIFPFGGGLAGYDADERDSYSHYFYLGVDQGITPTLNAAVRLGGQYTKYDNLDVVRTLNPDLEDSNWSPYVDANATWLYMPNSSAQLGIRHQRAQSDVGFIGTSPNLDAESTSVYGSINHQIVGGLVGSLIAQYQHSTYDDSFSGDIEDDYFMLGANLTYEINKFLAAELGYNYDRLDSGLSTANTGWNRSFTRNRVYIGIRGTY
jgi:hypothetical protein